MEVSFRRLVSPDASIYRPLRLEGLRDSPRAFTSTLEEESALTVETYNKRLAVEDNLTVGAFRDGMLVGIGTILRETRTATRHRGEIVGMYVTPSARGTGAAQGIMERLIAHARQVGVSWIGLEVVMENPRARRLYERFGFKPYGEVPRAHLHEGAWLDTTLMVLLLD